MLKRTRNYQYLTLCVYQLKEAGEGGGVQKFVLEYCRGQGVLNDL
jgi:hypothetical protein